MAYATLTAKIPSHQMEFIDELIKTGIAADRSAAIRGIIEAFIQEGKWEMPDVPKREKVAKKKEPKKQEAAEASADRREEEEEENPQIVPADPAEKTAPVIEYSAANPSADRSAAAEDPARIPPETAAKNRIITEGQTLEESFEKVIEDTKKRSEEKNYFKKSNRPDFTGWTEEQIREYRRLFPEHFD